MYYVDKFWSDPLIILVENIYMFLYLRHFNKFDISQIHMYMQMVLTFFIDLNSVKPDGEIAQHDET